MKILISQEKPEVMNEVEDKLMTIFTKETLRFLNNSIKFINFSTFEVMSTSASEDNKVEKFIGALGLGVQEDYEADSIREMISNFIKEVSFYDFVRDARSLFLTYNSMEQSTIVTFRKLILLVIRAYNQGKVEGIDLEQKSIVLSDALDSHDVILLTRLVMYFSDNSGAKLESELIDSRADEAEITKQHEDLIEILDLYLGLDESGFVNALREANIDDVRKLHYNMYFTAFRTDFNSIFNQVSPDYFTPINLPAVALDQVLSDNFTFQATTVITRYLKDFSMHKRTKLHTNKGVRLVFADDKIGFSTLQFREVHDGGTHLINVMYISQTGTRRSFAFDMTELDTAIQFLSCDSDCTAFLTVLAYYGVLDTYKPELEEFGRLCVPQGQLVIPENFQEPYDLINNFCGNLIQVISDMPEFCYAASLMDLTNYIELTDSKDGFKNHQPILSDLDLVESNVVTEEQNGLSEKYFIEVSETRKINIK